MFPSILFATVARRVVLPAHEAAQFKPVHRVRRPWIYAHEPDAVHFPAKL